MKFSVFDRTDLFAEVTYDSTDFDFGSFAGENFDTDLQEVGGALGFRTMIGDHFELKVQGRYSAVGDVDLIVAAMRLDDFFKHVKPWREEVE